MFNRFPPAAFVFRAALLGLLAAGGTASAATQSQRKDADSGAETWERQAHGVTLSLTQILPDQVRAFYLNRGFDAASTEIFATACVYMTVLRNDTAPAEVSYRLADWRIEVAGQDRRLRSVEDWLALWRERGLAEPARIAFRWAQFPPEQEFARGEWNQGMLALDLPAGVAFDLIARWTAAGQAYETRLTDVRCPR